MELPVDAIQRTGRGFIADRGAHRLPADYSMQTHIAHQAFNGAAGDGEPFTPHLPPDLAHAVNSKVLGEQPILSATDTTADQRDG